MMNILQNVFRVFEIMLNLWFVFRRTAKNEIEKHATRAIRGKGVILAQRFIDPQITGWERGSVAFHGLPVRQFKELTAEGE
jgi:hypothetical protein